MVLAVNESYVEVALSGRQMAGLEKPLDRLRGRGWSLGC